MGEAFRIDAPYHPVRASMKDGSARQEATPGSVCEAQVWPPSCVTSIMTFPGIDWVAQAVPPFSVWHFVSSVLKDIVRVASRDDVKTGPVAAMLHGQPAMSGCFGNACGCQVPPASWVT